jgi:hypothetical protein
MRENRRDKDLVFRRVFFKFQRRRRREERCGREGGEHKKKIKKGSRVGVQKTRIKRRERDDRNMEEEE